MVTLFPFSLVDAPKIQKYLYSKVSMEVVEDMIAQWNTKEFQGRYFEMFAVRSEGRLVGSLSLYQHTREVISLGPEIFPDERRRGYAKEAMTLGLAKAREMGFKIVHQQIRVENTASIALHQSLGFETNGAEFVNAKGNRVVFYLLSLT
ncbi:MAG: GNAT family N-acetyltransferase [Clostridia bacterium]|nr:GNAT family N-acetyltransferase [Clostridia bacterium]